MKDFSKEHPWMTFFLVLIIVNAITAIVVNAMHRKAIDMAIKSLASQNNLQYTPQVQSNQ
jgi:hypothetical protein